MVSSDMDHGFTEASLAVKLFVPHLHIVFNALETSYNTLFSFLRPLWMHLLSFQII